MKFALFVEGHAERKAIGPFLKRWLDPQLREPVGIMPVRFSGYGELLRDVAKRTRTLLNDPRQGADVIAVVSLLDFYGPSFPYPRDVQQTTERCAWAKRHIEGLVGNDRFRHFFAVHEFEAWLLSAPDLFPPDIRRLLPKQAPETVNTTQPPKARLRELYRQQTGRNYKETVNGPDLFGRLRPADAYARCPHLRALLDDMLALARQAGL